VGPRAGLDRCGRSRACHDSIPGMYSPQPVAIPTELSLPTRADVSDNDNNMELKCLFFVFTGTVSARCISSSVNCQQ
jgi:hypothetical protein